MARKFVICELDTATLQGRSIGAVHNAREQHISLSLTGLSTVSFQLGLNNPMATEITDRGGDVLLKVYRGSTLEFIGDCLSAEEVGDEKQTLACNFVSPLWRLSKRLIGVAWPGAPDGITFTATARNAIMTTILNGLNTEAEDTGIRVGTVDTLLPITAGPWLMKPVSEVFTELAASSVATFDEITSITDQDPFTWPVGGALNGKPLAGGGSNWTTSGATTDFTLDTASEYVYRSTASDSGTGRLAVASLTNHADQITQIDFGVEAIGQPCVVSVQAKYTDIDNRLYAEVNTYATGLQSLVVGVVVGGVHTPLWTSPLGTYLAAGTYFPTRYRLGVRADNDGYWAMWLKTIAGVDILTGQGTSAAVALLPDGKPAIKDWNSGAAFIRGYDNFVAGTPGAVVTEGLGFEIVPTEPTVDGTGVQIATLNIAERIGTDRPNVIFEYGGGNRAIKSYKRVISRDGLLTRAYTLPQDYATGSITVSSDQAAIDARGQYEEVVATDVVDQALRQAVGDLHVLFRKQARQIVTFDPSPTAPVFGTDWFVGDVVTARAIVNGTVRFNGLFKVYQVDITIDDEGRETVTPTLTIEA